MTDSEIDNIVVELDNDGNGLINYSEFMAATVDLEKHLTEDKLQALYNAFNVDGEQGITS